MLDRFANNGIRCMMMRGGTSKGLFFCASDLPADTAERNDLLLRIMGSPDPQQIDGLGGARRPTSKVAIVSPSAAPDADIEYQFLQVLIDRAEVVHQQTCGNLLAAVAPFALEREMIAAVSGVTPVRIRVLNDASLALARICTPAGQVSYCGETAISGVPGTAAAIPIEIAAGDRALLPAGGASTLCDGVEVTCLDAAKPFVLIRAADVEVTGYENPEELDANAALVARLGRIRIAAGRAMGLGDVTSATLPKLGLVAPPRAGGDISVRVFTPFDCHRSIGLLGAVSAAAGLRLEGSIAAFGGVVPLDRPVAVEHPAGIFQVGVRIEGESGSVRVRSITTVQTARKLFDGRVWPGPSQHRSREEGLESAARHGNTCSGNPSFK